MKIIAIIVTFNATKWIDKCFGSLLNSSLPVDVSVFDNNSSDKTVSLIRKKFPQVEVYESDENLGFGKANNIGLKIALKESYDYVFLLNQDAWIEKNTIKNLVEAHQRHPSYSILSPVPLFSNGQLDLKFRKFYATNEFLTNYDSDDQFVEVSEIPFINAAGWLLPFETILNYGFFDPVFNHYGEDVDYATRVQEMGGKSGIVSTSLYFHDRPQVTLKDTLMEKQVYHFFINQMLFKRWGDTTSLRKDYIILLLTVKELIRCIKERKYSLVLTVLRRYFDLMRKYKKLANKTPNFTL